MSALVLCSLFVKVFSTVARVQLKEPSTCTHFVYSIFIFFIFFPIYTCGFFFLVRFFFARSQSTDSRYLCISFTTWTWTERVLSPRELKRHYTIPKLRAMYLRRWNTAHRRHLKSNENPYQTQLNSHVHTLAKVHKVCFNPFNHDWYVFALGNDCTVFRLIFFLLLFCLLHDASRVSYVYILSWHFHSLRLFCCFFIHSWANCTMSWAIRLQCVRCIAIESFPTDLLMIQNYFTNYILFSHFWCLS